MTYTNEQLNAFLDNELEHGLMSEIREAIALDPALAQRFEDVAIADSAIRSVYSAIDTKPIPQSLVNLLSNSKNEQSHKISIPWIRRVWQSSTKPMVAASFGVLTLVAIVSLFSITLAPTAQTTLAVGPVSTTSNLHTALSTVPSAISSEITKKEHGIITPVLTFLNHQDRFCREFKLQSTQSGTRSVACYQDNQWSIELSIPDSIAENQNKYIPASSITPSAFENVVNSMILGDPISSDEEIRLIGNKWNKLDR